jgi:hypothetical protein
MQDRRSRRSRRARFAGCGGTARPHTGHQSAGNPGPFAWLRPSAAPADWKIARLPSRKAQLAYPPRWRAIRTDPGTFSAVLLGWHDRIRGYLNATPQSGAEILVNWASFRTAHNHEEGDATSFATPRRSGCDSARAPARA